MSQELEIRFHNFGKKTRDFCLKLKWDTINNEYKNNLSELAALLEQIILKLLMIWESWMKK